jgi:hypothetical protein
MIVSLSIDSASSALWWSNIVYIGGAVLTLGAAMHVRHEKRRVDAGQKSKVSFASEASVIAAAIVSLAGTAGAIYFGDLVGHLKDLELAHYQTQTGIDIAKANTATGVANASAGAANQKAEEAKLKAEATARSNAELQIELIHEQSIARTAEAGLSKQNEKTEQYTHALQMQQENMAQQMHVSPILNQAQIENMATLLKPYAGQSVAIHTTLDTTVLRLSATIQMALTGSDIKCSPEMDAGALYQGVSVVVHSPQTVPPLADALAGSLMSAGIHVNKVVLDTVPVGQVALYLGPS